MKKNAIYLMTFTRLWMDVAEQLQERHGWDPVLYVGIDDKIAPTKDTVLENVPFYDANEARRANLPDSLSFIEKAHLDAQTLDAYAPEQSIVYEMMSRFMLGKWDGSYDERRRFYWELLRIWEGIFQTLKPDVVVAGSLPHRIYDYMIYLLCERHGVPYIALDITAVPHLCYACTSVTDQAEYFREEMGKIDGDVKLSQATADFLAKTRKEYNEGKPLQLSLMGLGSEKRSKDGQSLGRRIMDALPQEADILLSFAKIALKGQLNRIMGTTLTSSTNGNDDRDLPTQARGWQMPVLQMKSLQRVRKAEHWYRDALEEPDYSKPFIYFPANFQPERSTVPDAHYFHDYHLIFAMLEDAVPEGWNIYYKEHPRSFHRPIERDNPRDVRFYHRLRRVCPRIKFIHPRTDPFQLVDNCKAVAIATGTTAWEAIARGKPVLSFGDYWYRGCPGVFEMRSKDQCQDALNQIETGLTVDDETLGKYLMAVESLCDNLTYYFRDNVRSRAQLYKGKRDDDGLAREEYIDFVSRMASEIDRGFDRKMISFDKLGIAKAP